MCRHDHGKPHGAFVGGSRGKVRGDVSYGDHGPSKPATVLIVSFVMDDEVNRRVLFLGPSDDGVHA